MMWYILAAVIAWIIVLTFILALFKASGEADNRTDYPRD